MYLHFIETVVMLNQGFNMTGCRKSNQDIQISLPDFSKSDVKRLLDCIYCGECVIQNQHEFGLLSELCKMLKLNALHSDLEYARDKIDQETESEFAQTVVNIPSKKNRQKIEDENFEPQEEIQGISWQNVFFQTHARIINDDIT